MSTNEPINDGGSAFPVTPTDRGGQCAPTECGMSLRDYFAAKAMQALLSNPESYKDGIWRYEGFKCSDMAYEIADDMVESRTPAAQHGK